MLKIDDLGDGVRRVSLNAPPVNALTADFLFEIEARFAGLETDAGVRAAILTGEGRALSAGMDLKSFAGMDATAQTRTVDALNACFGRLYGFSKPLVTAANGHALAGGLFFALSADHRLGVSDRPALFGLTEVRVGAPFPVAPLEIARGELAPSWFRRMMLRGVTIDAEAALTAGILDELAPAAELEAAAAAVARDLIKSPAGAYAAIKRQARGPALERIRRAVQDGDDPRRLGWLDAGAGDAAARVIRRRG